MTKFDWYDTKAIKESQVSFLTHREKSLHAAKAVLVALLFVLFQAANSSKLFTQVWARFSRANPIISSRAPSDLRFDILL
jgi:hypothetical protein